MNTSTVKQIEWSRSGNANPEGSATPTSSSSRFTPWIIILALAIFAAVVLAPVLDALIVYALYQHWSAGLAERANVQRGVIAALVPAAVTTILLVRKGNRRSLIKPWSWFRPWILLFFVSLTAVECAKLALGNEPVFGPKGQVRHYYVVRSDGNVVTGEHGGIDTVSGRRFQAITPENRDWVEGMRRGGTRLPQKVDPATHAWFLPGGQAILFYSERSGTLEFFDRPGRHPETNAELKDVTPAIRDRWEQEQHRKAENDQLRAMNDRISKLESNRDRSPSVSSNPQPIRDNSIESFNTVLRPTTPLPNFHSTRYESRDWRPEAHETQPDEQLHLEVRRPEVLPSFPRNPAASIPTQVPPLHRDCGTRHWPWALCPRFGLRRSRCGAPRHLVCGYFHWPSEPCPARDYSPICQHF